MIITDRLVDKYTRKESRSLVLCTIVHEDTSPMIDRLLLVVSASPVKLAQYRSKYLSDRNVFRKQSIGTKLFHMDYLKYYGTISQKKNTMELM